MRPAIASPGGGFAGGNPAGKRSEAASGAGPIRGPEPRYRGGAAKFQ
jgi:hypothetical protein